MKRIPRVKGTSYADYLAQNMVYYQMSNHYRRLYNAKCRVDTTTPYSIRLREQHRTVSEPQPTASDLALIDLIVNDTKHSPAAFSLYHKDNTWAEEGMVCNTIQTKETTSIPNQEQNCNGHHRKPHAWNQTNQTNKTVAVKARAAPDIMEQHSSNFVTPDGAFKPRILRTNAQSRVRELKVYHPPRRRTQQSKEAPAVNSQLQKNFKGEQQVEDGLSCSSSSGPWQQVALYSENTFQKNSSKVHTQSVEPWTQISICKCTVPEVVSKVSSRDSAYNGGVSSGESRGPTPEQSPVQTRPEVYDQLRRETRHNKRKEDSLYIKFIHEITQDVLNCGIYSNKGLEQVFQRHLNQNIGRLNQDRMKSEIRKLKIQLDIPEDNDVENEFFNSFAKQEQPRELPTCYWYLKSDTKKQSNISSSPDNEPNLSMQRQVIANTSLELDSLTSSELHQMCQGRNGKTKVIESNFTMTENEVVKTLEEMGFDSSTAKEICHSLSDKDMQPTLKLHSGNVLVEAEQKLNNSNKLLEENCIEKEVSLVHPESDQMPELKNNKKLKENIIGKEVVICEQEQAKCNHVPVGKEDSFSVGKFNQLPPPSGIIGMVMTSIVNQLDEFQTKNQNACSVQTDPVEMIAKQTETTMSLSGGIEHKNGMLEKESGAFEHKNSIREKENGVDIGPCGVIEHKEDTSESQSRRSEFSLIVANSGSDKQHESSLQNAKMPLDDIEIEIDDNDSVDVENVLLSSSVTKSSQVEDNDMNVNDDESICECLTENECQADSASEIEEEIESDSNNSASSVSSLVKRLKDFTLDKASLSTNIPCDSAHQLSRGSTSARHLSVKEERSS